MTDAVLIVGFGGPRSPDEIRPFLRDVLRGRPVPPERIEEVAAHYEHIGGRSPIVDLTEAQARALETELRARGVSVPVHVTHRFTDPRPKDALAALAAKGARDVLAVAMTAYEGPASSGRYEEAVGSACAELGDAAPRIRWARGMREKPGFVAAHVDSISRVLGPGDAPLVFTAHSIPVSSAKDTPYVPQLEETAAAVARAVGASRWRLAWQSRSGSPREPWLGPDVNDVIREEAKEGVRDLVLAPIGFLCEHVEILYDLDVEAAATAREVGVTLRRARALDDHPQFIAALADTVIEHLA